MKQIWTFSIPIVMIIALIGLLLKSETEIVNLKENIDKLRFKVENESVLKEKYFSMLKLQIHHQNEQVEKDIAIYDNGNLLTYNFSNIVKSNDLVLCIPENSCTDCVEKIIKALTNNVNVYTKRIIVLSVFFDGDEMRRFYKTYDISNKKWQVFHVDSKYFWNISDNRILLFNVNKENRFQNFIVLDGEFDKLLEIFLKFNL